MANDNLVIDDNVLNQLAERQNIRIADIIGANAAMYMKLILLSSIIILLYVVYTNFILGSRFDILAKHNIDVHELAILPSVALFVISIAYAGWI